MNSDISNLPLQPASQEIYETKYQLKEEDGTPVDKDIDGTYVRVARALSELEETDQESHYDDFLWALKNGAIPAGRITSNAGASKQKSNVSLINCLGAETPVLTDQGTFPIKELADLGTPVNVLNSNKQWKSVLFKNHGKQQLHSLYFKYADSHSFVKIRATSGHRWPLLNGRIITTEFWLTGGHSSMSAIENVIAHKWVHDQISYDKGLIHGLVYGDGGQKEPGYSNLDLIHDKQELASLVTEILGRAPNRLKFPTCEGLRWNGIRTEAELKDLPLTRDKSYLEGFFVGLLATDGCVSGNKKTNASTYVKINGSRKICKFIENVMPVIGITTIRNIKCASAGDITNYGKRNEDLWECSIHSATLQEQQILRSRHKKAFRISNNGINRSKRWTFIKSDDEVSLEDVYCCEETDTNTFCLANGLLTGNCVVSDTVTDSIKGIMQSVKDSGESLSVGNGIGYEFSTIRPKGAYVAGVGATTSGVLPFMDIFDKMCFTIASAGGRRGAQMATFDIRHPEVVNFIKAKREDGRFSQFNLSVLITDDFIEAVKNKDIWAFSFPITKNRYKEEDADDYIWRDFPVTDNYIVNDQGLVACEKYGSMPAEELWNIIMKSSYDFSEPGFLLIDRINRLNPLVANENIRATNPCFVARLH